MRQMTRDDAPDVRQGDPWAKYSLPRGCLRALRRRCPVCGSRRLSRHFLDIGESCPRCGLDLERQVGAYVGGVGVNTIVTFGAILVAVIVGFAITRGQGSVWPVLLPTLAVAVLLPIAFHVRSRLLWVAIELRYWPLEPGEVALPPIEPIQDEGDT